MGTMLRDWLGACLEEKLRAAIEWKEHQPGGAKASDEIKEEPLDDGAHAMTYDGDNPDSIFSYDHSNIYINVESSFELGENTFLQIKGIDSSEDRFPVTLSDGRTMIRAEFDEDVVRLFEKRHQRSLTQVVGGMINPSEFTIRATPLGDKQLSIVLVIRNFTYRKGSAGTGSAGHPKSAHKLPVVLEILASLRDLMLKEMRVSSPGLGNSAVTVHDDTTNDMQQLETISDPLSQTELASQEFATQAPIRDRPRKQVPDLSLAPGTNLARPVKLATTPQKKADSMSARNLLASFGLPQASVRPASQPTAQPMRVETSELDVRASSHVIGHDSGKRPNFSVAAAGKRESTSTAIGTEKDAPIVAAEPDDAAQEHVEEKQQITSTPRSVHHIDLTHEQASVEARPEPEAPLAESVVGPDNAPQAETKVAEVADASSSLNDFRRPDPKYVKYARRRIDRSQRELLEKPKSWLPSETRIPFCPHNIPADLLKELTAAQEEMIVRNKEQVGTQRRNVGVASNEDRSHGVDGQDLEKDEPQNSQPFSSWSASPEAHLQSEAQLQYRPCLGPNELPIDSSAPEPPLSTPSRLDRNELPVDSSASTLLSSSPRRSSDAMDIDEESDGSDDSGLAVAAPRPLRAEHSLHHQVIKATPVESIANVKAGLKTPTQHSSSIVLDSTARLSGQAQASERNGHPNKTMSSPAKRALDNPEETAPKPKKLHKQPIKWGTDEQCKEDPVKQLQREKIERLHKEREQAASTVDNPKSPWSFRLIGPQHERDQDSSECSDTDHAPSDDSAETQRQISTKNGVSGNAHKNTSRAFKNPKRKHAVKQVNLKLGSGWFSGIPDRMRGGATKPTQLPIKVLKKLASSVQDGDNIQDLVSAWQRAIERRHDKEVRPIGCNEYQWAGLLACDVEAVTNGRQVVTAEGKPDPLSSKDVSQRTNQSIATPVIISPSTASAASKRNGNAFAQQRDLRSLPPSSVDRPYLQSPHRDSSSPRSVTSLRARQIERTSSDQTHPRRPDEEQGYDHWSPPRGSAREQRFRSRSPARESWDDQEYRPRPPPRGLRSSQQSHPRSPARAPQDQQHPRTGSPPHGSWDDREYRPRSPPRGPRSEQQSRPRPPTRASQDQQQPRSRSPPRRWPGETTFPVNESIIARYAKRTSGAESKADRPEAHESIFAKFARGYNELKLVKHEKKKAGLDQSEGRRIDVLGWKL